MSARALILAGSRGGGRDVLERAMQVDQKALLPIRGRPMIDWVISALRASPEISALAISATPTEALRACVGDIPIVEMGHGPSGSVGRALEIYDTPLLITTADHPLLRPEWIREFIAQASGDCDFAIAIATRAAILRDVPGTKRTFIRLADIQFSGCNMFYAATPKAKALVQFWQNIERNRKKPWRLALGIGWPVIWDILRRRLTTERLATHIYRLTGATIKFVSINDGRAAVDVDKPSDLALVEEILTAAPHLLAFGAMTD
ncbi:NTP-transf-3 domain-containing protein [Acetobacteraceae bacterium EV16G]|uniref:NTP-transf-3 domain-containing protein n=1 Tax=Sorlinia euscelidii TaxID=3081148 RepID=A0ABU7U3S2_9PROT